MLLNLFGIDLVFETPGDTGSLRGTFFMSDAAERDSVICETRAFRRMDFKTAGDDIPTSVSADSFWACPLDNFSTCPSSLRH
jgi:hypothetical protein